ncbi:unnamed protein product [Arctia plantaginis]|uniref:Uncharacterized protein n=1 Tax=Arctia plantaginis TaxID=874455 RepID=A0A8S0ZYI1_ARCPL|nr:unnamed protein product [Arctia plantaginis]
MDTVHRLPNGDGTPPRASNRVLKQMHLITIFRIQAHVVDGRVNWVQSPILEFVKTVKKSNAGDKGVRCVSLGDPPPPAAAAAQRCGDASVVTRTDSMKHARYLHEVPRRAAQVALTELVLLRGIVVNERVVYGSPRLPRGLRRG